MGTPASANTIGRVTVPPVCTAGRCHSGGRVSYGWPVVLCRPRFPAGCGSGRAWEEPGEAWEGIEPGRKRRTGNRHFPLCSPATVRVCNQLCHIFLCVKVSLHVHPFTIFTVNFTPSHIYSIECCLDVS